MTVQLNLPSDELMLALTRQAILQATEMFAVQADNMADKLEGWPTMTGDKALRAFAAAIRSNNETHFGDAN